MPYLRTKTGGSVAEGALRGAAATGGAAPGTAARATFRGVFANSEFRALWLAQLLSVAGDQLARVAMTVLVYDRTRSPLLTALTYAVTFLPWIVGGLALSGLADRFPRREVMIACDLARMVLVCAMVAVSLGAASALLWVMVALLFFVTLLDSPFKAARAALIADILTGERYVIGTTVTQLTFQAGTVAGFALGGVVVAALGSRTALFADAVTFALSALLLVVWVSRRGAAASGTGPQGLRSQWADMGAGLRLVFGDHQLRTLMFFGWLVAFYAIPMGLAAPFTAGFHGISLAVGTGLVFAAIPLGSALGTFVLGRLVSPARRQRLIGPLAVGSCCVLVLCATHPGFAACLAIFVLAGTCAGYQIAANAAFVAAVPTEHRGQAFGLANGGMQVLQGLSFVIAGAIAQDFAPTTVIALLGAFGTCAAATLLATRRSSDGPRWGRQ
jgi:MFS family permease